MITDELIPAASLSLEYALRVSLPYLLQREYLVASYHRTCTEIARARVRAHTSAPRSGRRAALVSMRNVRRVPARLIFCHHTNLLTHDPAHLNKTDGMLLNNIRNTIAIHTPSSGRRPNVSFYTTHSDDSCLQVLQEIEPRLLPHFRAEPRGAFKSDICRGAALWKHGGLYFDSDVVLRMPVPPLLRRQTEFASMWAVGQNQREVVQAFIAAAPGSATIRRYLDFMLEYYDARAATGTTLGGAFMGTRAMGLAYSRSTPAELEVSQMWRETFFHSKVCEGNMANSTPIKCSSHTVSQMCERGLDHIPLQLPYTGMGIFCNLVAITEAREVPFFMRPPGKGPCPALGEVPPSTQFRHVRCPFPLKREAEGG